MNAFLPPYFAPLAAGDFSTPKRPFTTGQCAVGVVEGAMYNYEPAPADVLDRVRRIEAICAHCEVPLAAAALQFFLGEPAVTSVIPCARTPGEVIRNVTLFDYPIPGDLWQDLKAGGLLREDFLTPSQGGD